MINSLYNHKSKEFNISKKNFDKIFKEIEAEFFIEINVTTTSILNYLNNKNNNLIHFSCPYDVSTFRNIRDDYKNIAKKIKSLKFDKNYILNYEGEHDFLLCFIKKYIELNESSKKIPLKEISSFLKSLSGKLNKVFISNKNSLDIVKAFNESQNCILIHLNNVNYQSFFKIHGNFLMFHKAKIILIGNELSEHTVNLKKYGFKSWNKKLTKDSTWSKNI